uniref:Uncharacterized protein n=1 Tax=Scleropages formosus TaxID=113540 RepID=A0A8C9SVJ8_SCLFO
MRGFSVLSLLPGHLLLLLCMAASEIPDARARPADFVCDDSARRDMNKAKELEANACGGSSVLPVPVQLPCAKIHKASWEIQTVSAPIRKTGLIVLTMRESAQRDAVRRQLDSILLEQLDSSVTNHLLIVRHLALPGTGVQVRGVSASFAHVQGVKHTHRV